MTQYKLEKSEKKAWNICLLKGTLVIYIFTFAISYIRGREIDFVSIFTEYQWLLVIPVFPILVFWAFFYYPNIYAYTILKKTASADINEINVWNILNGKFIDRLNARNR